MQRVTITCVIGAQCMPVSTERVVIIEHVGKVLVALVVVIHQVCFSFELWWNLLFGFIHGSKLSRDLNRSLLVRCQFLSSVLHTLCSFGSVLTLGRSNVMLIAIGM